MTPISSHTATSLAVCRLAEIIRGHWSVENHNHRRPDVWWGEDRCRLRRSNAACALALVIPQQRPMPELFAAVIARPSYGLRLLNSK